MVEHQSWGPILGMIVRFAVVGSTVHILWHGTLQTRIQRNLLGWNSFQTLASQRERRIFLSAKFAYQDRFASQVRDYQEQVQATGLFDNVFAYYAMPDFIRNETRYHDSHLDFLDNPRSASKRGGGWWFWKSVLIRHHLESLNDNDYLMYADPDLWEQFNWTENLLESMADRSANLALYEMQYLERQYCKGDVYRELCPNVNPETDESLSNAGGFVVLRKAPGTVEFVKQWQHFVQNAQLINDEPSLVPNAPDFKDHRHDQAILNALLKCVYNSPGKQAFDVLNRPSMRDTQDKGNVDTVLWNIHTYRIPD